jgi:Kef-type K+ transport system membrane component KefB
MDLATHALIVSCIALKFDGSHQCNVLSAIAMVTGWLNSLSYLRGYEKTGPLLRMIIEITVDSLPFLLVLMVLILAFSVGFFMLFATANHDALMFDR